jgi:hypothetical protein
MKLILHVYPIKDKGHKHELTQTCECQPDIDDGPKVAIIQHKLVGLGLGQDEWRISAEEVEQ